MALNVVKQSDLNSLAGKAIEIIRHARVERFTDNHGTSATKATETMVTLRREDRFSGKKYDGSLDVALARIGKELKLTQEDKDFVYAAAKVVYGAEHQGEEDAMRKITNLAAGYLKGKIGNIVKKDGPDANKTVEGAELTALKGSITGKAALKSLESGNLMNVSLSDIKDSSNLYTFAKQARVVIEELLIKGNSSNHGPYVERDEAYAHAAKLERQGKTKLAAAVRTTFEALLNDGFRVGRWNEATGEFDPRGAAGERICRDQMQPVFDYILDKWDGDRNGRLGKMVKAIQEIPTSSRA